VDNREADYVSAATLRSVVDFSTAYDTMLARWPVPVTTVDIPSAYGTARVNVSGPADGSPLVLLHGGGTTSMVWFANVGALAGTHRVFAIDHGGRSVLDGQPFASVDDLMAWLDGLLAGLGLARAAVCGYSYDHTMPMADADTVNRTLLEFLG
jgi:pimeloyl-ACP methyl ester carboxylesterase